MKKTLLLLLFLGGVLVFLLSQTKVITGLSIFENKESQEASSIPCSECNVILIVIESLRADHLGSYGYERKTTPNIDRLAAEGMIFENFIATAPWITPATASLFTGLYPGSHGARRIGKSIDEEVQTLPEILQKNGFATHGFTPTKRSGAALGFGKGFDSYTGLFEEEYESANIVNEEVFSLLKKVDKNTKLFLYVQYADLKADYIPKEKFFSKKNKKEWEDINTPLSRRALDLINSPQKKELAQHLINLYDDEMRFMDKHIGKLLDQLKDEGRYDNSIIIITSAYGESFGEHVDFFSHGKSFYDQELKVPFIVKLPGKRWKGRVEKLASQIDLMPTLLPLLGIPAQTSPRPVEGINLFSPAERSHVFSSTQYIFDKRTFIFWSMRSLDEKLTKTIHLGLSPSTTWIPHSLVGTVLSTDGKGLLWVRAPEGNATLELLVGDQVIDQYNITQDSWEIEIPLKKENPSEYEVRNFTLRSLTPCVSLNQSFGIFNDTRCVSFGFVIPNKIGLRVSPKDFHPFSFYFSLKDDPTEEINQYSNPDFQERVSFLREKLDVHITAMNTRE